MKGLKKIVCLCLLVGFVGLSLAVADEIVAPFGMPSARAGALGGFHSAYGDDIDAIFSNPALFVGIKKQLSVAEVTASIYVPRSVAALEDPAKGKELWNAFTGFDIATLLNSMKGIAGDEPFAAGLDLAGPLSIGWVGKGLGLGLFNRTTVDFSLSGLNVIPYISEDVLLTAGYGFRVLNFLGSTLDVGVLAKGFFRGAANPTIALTSINSIIDDPTQLGSIKSYLGFGFDVGVRYTFAGFLSAGVVMHDVYSPVWTQTYTSVTSMFGGDFLSSGWELGGTVKRNLDAGIAVYIPPALRLPVLSHAAVLVDFHDIIGLFEFLEVIDYTSSSGGIPRNPILNLGIGVEATLFDLLSLRIGIADALPSVGLGLNLFIFQLNVSIHGKELGLDPGDHPVFEADIGLQFRY